MATEAKNAAKALEPAFSRDGAPFMNPLHLCTAIEEVSLGSPQGEPDTIPTASLLSPQTVRLLPS